jgi:hypothetical protein
MAFSAKKLPNLKELVVLGKPEHYFLAESALRNPFMPENALPRAHSAPSLPSHLGLLTLP